MLDSSCDDSNPRDYTNARDVSSLDGPQSHFSASEQYVLAPDLESYIRRLLRIQK